MKYNIIKFLPALLLLGLISCENSEWEFPDYKYTTVYFPYQTPVRSLVLGDYDLADNSKDNNLQFSIGVTMGGVYKNTKDRVIDYVLDETLTNNLYTNTNVKILPLPAAYYTLSPTGTTTIPAGQYTGYIDVQLKDAFLDDPNSINNVYVIPLKIVDAHGDSILRGKSNLTNPDLRISSNWELAPKNYTLFGIKYLNPYHGKYLLRGIDVTKDLAGTQVDQVIYHQKFVEDNAIRPLTTAGRSKVQFTAAIRKTSGGQGNFTAELTFAENGDCTVTSTVASALPVTGSGKFVREGDTWGGKKRNVIYLNYQVTDAAHSETHQINDTLVIRDRDVRLQTFTAVIK